ncbi:hypothetical protein [Natronobeatus ordinarius]|uniref:hypothetical protein n=1 Tax=Natronobeatus ordinarius TaxID=2963433 RepID=UPI0020CDE4BC|nr:hypothetical protein [Natronobeatus ordinarius]
MIRFQSTSGTEASGDRSNPEAESGGRTLQTILLALAVGAILYFLLQRRRPDEPDLPVDEVRETAESVLEGGREIPIGDPIRERLEADEGSAGDDVDEADADETDESDLGAEPSAAEVEARVEEDVQERPAEPGEMTIDEDVADEVVDEEIADADEDAAGDEEASEAASERAEEEASEGAEEEASNERE